MLHVIVTGPESSGKTTLTTELATELAGLAIPEYARGYLGAAGRRAVLSDFTHFARAVPQLLGAARKQGRALVQDTGFEVLRLWVEDKFGVVPDTIESGYQHQRPTAYVLCAPDLPWEYDPLREDPHRRDQLFVRYRDLLAQTGVPVLEARGQGPGRVAAVLAVIGKLPPSQTDWESP